MHTAAIGGRLEAIAARARAALAVLPHAPDQARAHLTEATGVARHAMEQVRETVVEDRPDHSRPAPRRPGNTVAPRLALLVLVVVLGASSVHHLVIVADTFVGEAAKAAGSKRECSSRARHRTVGTHAPRRDVRQLPAGGQVDAGLTYGVTTRGRSSP